MRAVPTLVHVGAGCHLCALAPARHGAGRLGWSPVPAPLAPPPPPPAPFVSAPRLNLWQQVRGASSSFASGAAAGAPPGAADPGEGPAGGELPAAEELADFGLAAGPILADYLAVGAGPPPAPPAAADPRGLAAAADGAAAGAAAAGAAAAPAGAAALRRPAPLPRPLPRAMPQPMPRRGLESPPPAAQATAEEDPRPAAAVRERRLAKAALRPGEALEKVQLRTPPRAAVAGVPMRTPGRERRLFLEGYSEVAERFKANLAGQAAGGARAADVPPQRQRAKLKVLPWHRVKLQRMLCKALLYAFLQSQRQALQLRTKQKPLWPWEAAQAQKYAEAGEVAALVRYLARTRLHLELGQKRRLYRPGTVPVERAEVELSRERRELLPQWEAAGLLRDFEDFDEDAYIRAFLDGHLSEPKVKQTLRDIFGLPQVLQTGTASPKAQAAAEQ